jgi:hypothetical protein
MLVPSARQVRDESKVEEALPCSVLSQQKLREKLKRVVVDELEKNLPGGSRSC